MSEIDYNTRDLQVSLMRLQEENNRLRVENTSWIKASEKFSIKSKKLEYELQHIKSIIFKIEKLIEGCSDDI